MAAIDGVASATAAGPGIGQDPRLIPAAHEFEACLMKELLEPLQHDALFSDATDGARDDEEGSGGALTSFGSEALGQAISERGGFGIADRIIGHFNSANQKKAEAPAKL
jgi:peptidoglycan hydrolase FlgJ